MELVEASCLELNFGSSPAMEGGCSIDRGVIFGGLSVLSILLLPLK